MMTIDSNIELAAHWLMATPRDGRGGPAVPALKDRFGLNAHDAIEAIRRANELRMAPNGPSMTPALAAMKGKS